MPGTRVGGQRAAATNKSRYGTGFYSQIGQVGGKIGRTGGFASGKIGSDGLTGRQRASVAGTVGGRKSRRIGVPNKVTKE